MSESPNLIPLAEIENPRDALFFRLSGGLGNLLFQYLAGQALARHLDVPIHYVPDVPMIHNSGLERLGISVAYAEVPAELVLRANRRRDRTLGDRLKTALGRWPLTPVREPHFHHWEGFTSIRPGSLVFGYWQSPRYFDHLGDLVAGLLRPGQVREQDPGAPLDELAQPGSVGVHVRRNDFASRPENVAVHGLMGRTYYDRARAAIESNTDVRTFYVFSDDVAAAQELLGHWGRTVFMPMREQEIDMILLAQCQHHIIANSTFSWWPAYVAASPEQKVIAPRHWFSRQTMLSRYTLDLIPDAWVQVAG